METFKDTVKNVNKWKYASTLSHDATDAVDYSIYSNESRLPINKSFSLLNLQNTHKVSSSVCKAQEMLNPRPWPSMIKAERMSGWLTWDPRLGVL